MAKRKANSKPLYIAGLPFYSHGRNQLRHVFDAQPTGEMIAAEACGIESRPELLLSLNDPTTAMEEHTAINAAIVSPGRVNQMAFATAYTEETGTLRQLCRRDFNAVEDAVIACLIRFGGEYIGVIQASLRHSVALAVTAETHRPGAVCEASGKAAE